MASGRGLWSPNTSVTDPIKVLRQLKTLEEQRVGFIYNSKISKIDSHKNIVELFSGEKLEYGHLFNCAGLYALDISKRMNAGADTFYYHLREIIGISNTKKDVI